MKPNTPDSSAPQRVEFWSEEKTQDLTGNGRSLDGRMLADHIRALQAYALHLEAELKDALCFCPHCKECLPHNDHEKNCVFALARERDELRAQLAALPSRKLDTGTEALKQSEPDMRSVEEICAEALRTGDNGRITVPVRWLAKKLATLTQSPQPDTAPDALRELLEEAVGWVPYGNLEKKIKAALAAQATGTGREG